MSTLIFGVVRKIQFCGCSMSVKTKYNKIAFTINNNILTVLIIIYLSLSEQHTPLFLLDNYNFTWKCIIVNKSL